MFERLLTTVHNVGSREELSLSYLRDAEENTAFRDDMEHAVLSALKTWAENRTAAPVPTPPPPQRTKNEPRETPVNVSRKGYDVTNLNADTDTDEIEEREPYYWENF